EPQISLRHTRAAGGRQAREPGFRSGARGPPRPLWRRPRRPGNMHARPFPETGLRAMHVRRVLRRSRRAARPGCALVLAALVLTGCDGGVEAESSGPAVT